jgi:hypothetical protein
MFILKFLIYYFFLLINSFTQKVWFKKHAIIKFVYLLIIFFSFQGVFRFNIHYFSLNYYKTLNNFNNNFNSLNFIIPGVFSAKNDSGVSVNKLNYIYFIFNLYS